METALVVGLTVGIPTVCILLLAAVYHRMQQSRHRPRPVSSNVTVIEYTPRSTPMSAKTRYYQLSPTPSNRSPGSTPTSILSNSSDTTSRPTFPRFHSSALSTRLCHSPTPPASVHLPPVVRAAVQCHWPQISQVVGPVSRAATQVGHFPPHSRSSTSASKSSLSRSTSMAATEPDTPLLQTAARPYSWEPISRPDSAAYIPPTSSGYISYSPATTRAGSAGVEA